MDKLQQIMDSLVRSVPAYPITLGRILVAPRQVLNPPVDSLSCSSTVAFMFSLILGYFIHGYLAGRVHGGPGMFEAPPIGWMVFSVIFIAVLGASQAVLVEGLLARRWTLSIPRDVEPFIYAYAIILPLGGLLPLFKRQISVVPASLLVTAVLLLYAWALFNMIGAGFRLKPWQRGIGTLISFITLPVVGGIGFLLLILPFR